MRTMVLTWIEENALVNGIELAESTAQANNETESNDIRVIYSAYEEMTGFEPAIRPSGNVANLWTRHISRSITRC